MEHVQIHLTLSYTISGKRIRYQRRHIIQRESEYLAPVHIEIVRRYRIVVLIETQVIPPPRATHPTGFDDKILRPTTIGTQAKIPYLGEENSLKEAPLFFRAFTERLEKQGLTKEDAVNAHFEKANEFRRQNKKIDKFEHPMHVYAKSDKFAKGHSLTTTKKEKGATAEALEMRENPNPEDKRDSWFIPTSKTVPLAQLSDKPLKKWKLNKSDDKKMKPFRDSPFDK